MYLVSLYCIFTGILVNQASYTVNLGRPAVGLGWPWVKLGRLVSYDLSTVSRQSFRLFVFLSCACSCQGRAVLLLQLLYFDQHIMLLLDRPSLPLGQLGSHSLVIRFRYLK